jgi:hypothetical protein
MNCKHSSITEFKTAGEIGFEPTFAGGICDCCHESAECGLASLNGQFLCAICYQGEIDSDN